MKRITDRELNAWEKSCMEDEIPGMSIDDIQRMITEFRRTRLIYRNVLALISSVSRVAEEEIAERRAPPSPAGGAR